MSALPEPILLASAEDTIPAAVFERIDQHRGTSAMKLVIATEAMLFVVLFFGYFFLSAGDPRWLHEKPPSFTYSLPMLAILLLSSLVLWLGERASKKEQFGLARLAIAGTVLLGCFWLWPKEPKMEKHLMESEGLA